jgi:hypothetical protein
MASGCCATRRLHGCSGPHARAGHRRPHGGVRRGQRAAARTLRDSLLEMRHAIAPSSLMFVGVSRWRDCVRTLSDTPSNPRQIRSLTTRRDRSMLRKSFESAQVGCDLSQSAPPESISKRVPSTTRTSLRLESRTTSSRQRLSPTPATFETFLGSRFIQRV